MKDANLRRQKRLLEGIVNLGFFLVETKDPNFDPSIPIRKAVSKMQPHVPISDSTTLGKKEWSLIFIATLLVNRMEQPRIVTQKCQKNATYVKCDGWSFFRLGRCLGRNIKLVRRFESSLFGSVIPFIFGGLAAGIARLTASYNLIFIAWIVRVLAILAWVLDLEIFGDVFELLFGLSDFALARIEIVFKTFAEGMRNVTIGRYVVVEELKVAKIWAAEGYFEGKAVEDIEFFP